MVDFTVRRLQSDGNVTVPAEAGGLSLTAFLLVFAAIAFNFCLCFINTNVTGISSAAVIGCELVIVSITFAVSYRSVGAAEAILIAGTALYLLCLALVRASDNTAAFDPKIIRDFMIPIAFFLLGQRVWNIEAVDTFVRGVALIVVAIAIFEYFYVETYLQYFNVIMYYIARGSVESSRLEILSTNLFVSGIRPEGRSLLPFLGDHRVSSIFLEPVSPGSFAVILFYWALIRSISRKTVYYGLFAMAVFLTIMADNRFGAYLCGLALVAALIPIRFLYMTLMVAPAFAIVGLLGIAIALPSEPIDNSLMGRLLSSGRSLESFDLAAWFGLSGDAAISYDSGYSYTIGQIGIVGFVVFWAVFMMIRARSAQFQLYRVFCGLYFVAFLCVSYAPYTIKTAALLWFLLGVVSAADDWSDLGRDSVLRATETI
jgi:putative polymerase